MRRGVVLPDSQLAVIGYEDLFETSDLVARPDGRRRPSAAFAADMGDLKPGDLVVHAAHGLGKFVGLREISHGEQSGDFMLLEYADGGRLVFP